MAHNRSRAMTGVEIATGLLIICALCPGTGWAEDEIVDWDGWRVHVENWIGAASVAVPTSVGTLAAGLAAAPSTVKGTLILKCNQNMQLIMDELDPPPTDKARENELKLMLEKNRHVMSALDGKPEDLREFLTKLQQQGSGTAAAAPAPTMLDTDR